MAPFVPELLDWLKDANWPPYGACWLQLTRFPELAVDPIRQVLRDGEDGEWEEHLLQFIEREMPPEVRETARAEVERVAQRPTQDEIDCEAVEAANDCLREMDGYLNRANM
ncbi:hypothetical protein DFH07DRAFT_726162 [Mycena maculata]|uniref:DUF5071 domain-containing protein n=1 Tax=Mycena maculata TaxID=230809 RepID=A0AAD7KGU0_9AGAR|nr:hypothetical protein DFH07DRAFT_726162 [Mycena maculata]